MAFLQCNTHIAISNCNPGEKAGGGTYDLEFHISNDENIISAILSISHNIGWKVNGKMSVYVKIKFTAFVGY